MSQSDFMDLAELSQCSGLSQQTLYNQRHRGGVLAPILTKFGGRIGAWRADWEVYKASQRRLPAAPAVGDLDAANVQATSINNHSGTTHEQRDNTAAK
jgi:hypothetical protein